MDNTQKNSSIISKLSKPISSGLSSKKILLIIGIIILLITVFVGMEPRFHYRDGGGVCKVSGWVALGKPATRRTCLCLGAVSPTRTGWFEGPSSYTCGGLGVSFLSPLSAAGNISSILNKYRLFKHNWFR